MLHLKVFFSDSCTRAKGNRTVTMNIIFKGFLYVGVLIKSLCCRPPFKLPQWAGVRWGVELLSLTWVSTETKHILAFSTGGGVASHRSEFSGWRGEGEGSLVVGRGDLIPSSQSLGQELGFRITIETSGDRNWVGGLV